MANEAKLDVGGGRRPHYQPRTGTLVCRARQEPQSRSRRRKSRGLHFPSERSRRADRGSGTKRSTSEVEMQCDTPAVFTRKPSEGQRVTRYVLERLKDIGFSEVLWCQVCRLNVVGETARVN